MKKEVVELRVQSIHKDKEVAEVKTKEEDSWAIVAKKMKSHNVFERLEKVESDMIVKKSVIRKEVKSTNEEETRKKRIMIFNLKNKTGKSDVECVKDVFGKMGAGQSSDDVVDMVRFRLKENGPIIRPIIVEFRSEYDKWTVMRIFCLRQLQVKSIEQDQPLYIVFVDFTKAFDIIGRTGLWAAAEEIWMSKKFTTMIESLYIAMIVNVRSVGEIPDIFAITNGVKQGCVLAPTLLSIFLSAMLEEAFRDMGDRVYIQSRQNADFFTVEYFRAKITAFRRWQHTDCPLSRALLMHLPLHHESLALR